MNSESIHLFHEFIHEFGCTKVPDARIASESVQVMRACLLQDSELTGPGKATSIYSA